MILSPWSTYRPGKIWILIDRVHHRKSFVWEVASCMKKLSLGFAGAAMLHAKNI